MRAWKLIPVLLIAAIVHAHPAFASIYDFSGTCSDCTGIASGNSLVTGTLTLVNDITGQQLDASNFVSFSYTGSDKQGPFTLDPNDDSITFSAIFGNQPSQYAAVTIQGTVNQQTTDPNTGNAANQQFTFITGTDGSFNLYVNYVNGGGGSSPPPTGNVDQGTNAAWDLESATSVPEPPSLWLFIAAAGTLLYPCMNRSRSWFSRSRSV